MTTHADLFRFLVGIPAVHISLFFEHYLADVIRMLRTADVGVGVGVQTPTSACVTALHQLKTLVLALDLTLDVAAAAVVQEAFRVVLDTDPSLVPVKSKVELLQQYCCFDVRSRVAMDPTVLLTSLLGVAKTVMHNPDSCMLIVRLLALAMHPSADKIWCVSVRPSEAVTSLVQCIMGEVLETVMTTVASFLHTQLSLYLSMVSDTSTSKLMVQDPSVTKLLEDRKVLCWQWLHVLPALCEHTLDTNPTLRLGVCAACVTVGVTLHDVGVNPLRLPMVKTQLAHYADMADVLCPPPVLELPVSVMAILESKTRMQT